MGQAKRRGTFEQRKAESIVRKEQESIQRAEAAAQRLRAAEKNMFHAVRYAPRPRRNRAVVTAAVMMAIVAGSKIK